MANKIIIVGGNPRACSRLIAEILASGAGRGFNFMVFDDLAQGTLRESIEETKSAFSDLTENWERMKRTKISTDPSPNFINGGKKLPRRKKYK